MRFDPKSDHEIQAMDLLPEGIYQCEVVQATDKISKSGNEMIELKIRVWDLNGKERLIFDYLLPQMARKLKHFAVATSMQDKYDLGTIMADDCSGKFISVEITIQPGNPKPDGSGHYAAKNSVKDYMASSNKPEKSTEESSSGFDDDIPF